MAMAAMLLAMLTVVWTMGALTGTGNTLHIMSSMLPIFLMPIAILDSIHVLSEFYDYFPRIGDRAATLRHVYGDLRRPLAFTSLTTAVGFGSLALAPIPPVQVFGIFVALGVAFAWLLTLTLLPAFVMLVDEQRLARELSHGDDIESGGILGRALHGLGEIVIARRTVILVGFAVIGVVAIPAVTQIEINDNPVRWFRSSHDIRQASEQLNDRLPGTFGASLVLRTEPGGLASPDVVSAVAALDAHWETDPVVGTASTFADLVPEPTQAGDALAEARSRSPLVGTLVTDDLSAANLRLQLRSGDNQAMRSVVDRTDAFLEENPLPAGIVADWAGESYLNAEWQDEMVSGMLVAFSTTLGVILLLMVLLFRSIGWAVLAVTPVLWTVLVVYGVIGAVGKDYDMPIAVLSTMVLGIGVDFAIHYVERYRELVRSTGDALAAQRAFFGEPARALSRNALIIAIGFTPLFLSSLVPYVVVGAFLAAIIVLSWLVTIVGLPAATSLRPGSTGRAPADLDGRDRVPASSATT